MAPPTMAIVSTLMCTENKVAELAVLLVLALMEGVAAVMGTVGGEVVVVAARERDTETRRVVV